MVREVGGHYDYQVQPNSLTTVTARVGRSTSKGSDTSGKSGLSTFPKQRDKTEHWRRIGRGTQKASSSSYVSYLLSDLPLLITLTFVYPRLVCLLLPLQRSSLRAISNCPPIPAPQLSSFCNRYPTSFPRSRRAAPPPPPPLPLNQPTAIHPVIRPRPPFALTSSGSSA